MKRVHILTPCKVDGKHHMPSEPGKHVDMRGDAADALIASGAVALVEPDASARPENIEALNASIRAAAEEAGETSVAALGSKLGYKITAAERDAALASAE